MFKVESIEANRAFGGFLVQAHCMLVTVDCTEVDMASFKLILK